MNQSVYSHGRAAVRDVRAPELVQGGRGGVPLEQDGTRFWPVAGARGPRPLPTCDPAQPRRSHQSFHGAARDRDALPASLSVELPLAMTPEELRMNVPHLREQLTGSQCASRGRAGDEDVVGARRRAPACLWSMSVTINAVRGRAPLRKRPRPTPGSRSSGAIHALAAPDQRAAQHHWSWPRTGGPHRQQKGPGVCRGTSDESLSHGFSSGAKGIRTPDLFHAMEARYQLRHSPSSGAVPQDDSTILPRL